MLILCPNRPGSSHLKPNHNLVTGTRPELPNSRSAVDNTAEYQEQHGCVLVPYKAYTQLCRPTLWPLLPEFRVKNCSSSHFCCCWCFSSAADEVKEEYTKNYFIVKRKKVLKTTKTCSKLSPCLFLSQDHCHVTYRSQEVSHTCLGILVTILTLDTHRVFLGDCSKVHLQRSFWQIPTQTQYHKSRISLI